VNITERLLDRFNAKFDRRGSEECWPWTASLNECGYGNFRTGWRMDTAHRVAWVISRGQPIPEGCCILHKCDNPACVNPKHLLIATHETNMNDMARKGRANKPLGELNGRATLTWEIVGKIRADHMAGLSAGLLVSKYWITRGTAYNIIAGRTWNSQPT